MDYSNQIAFRSTEDDKEDFMLDNSDAEYLHEVLFTYVGFVNLTMHQHNTGKVEPVLFRQSVLHVFNESKGIADIQQSCHLVASCIDNLEDNWLIIAPIITDLIKKFNNV